MKNVFGITVELIENFIEKQHALGYWSDEDELRNIFITTNRIACTLIQQGIPRNHKTIKKTEKCIKKWLRSGQISIEDEANSLEFLLLMDDISKYKNDLIEKINNYILEKKFGFKKLFPLMMLDFIDRFNNKLILNEEVIKKLKNHIKNNIRNEKWLKYYHIAELSYFLYISTKYDFDDVKNEVIKIKKNIKNSWRPLSIENIDFGWSESITANAYIMNNIINSDFFNDNEFESQYKEIVNSLLCKYLEERRKWIDKSNIFPVKNEYYVTAIIIGSIHKPHRLIKSNINYNPIEYVINVIEKLDLIAEEKKRLRKQRRGLPVIISSLLGFTLGISFSIILKGTTVYYEIISTFTSVISLATAIFYTVDSYRKKFKKNE